LIASFVTMTTRTLFGLAALAISLLATTDGSARAPKTLDVRVGSVSIEKGKVNAALLSGADQGIMPGDRGFFTKNGQKVAGSEFEVQRIGDRIAWTVTGFPTTDELRFRTSLTARVTSPERTCTSKGTKIAHVLSARRESDSSIFFTIDKGAQDGVMPKSTVASEVGTVDITLVGANTASGIVRDVANPDEAANAFRRIVYESFVCRAK
jgi:hypothetical protein